jgi:hypothetical protein
MYNATHNLYIFNHHNILYAFGGQVQTKKHIKKVISNKNYPQHFLEFVNNDSNYIYPSIIENNEPYINSNIHCPFFSNGLYLFKFKSNDVNSNFTIENNNLPILSGVKDGRHDAIYCITDNIDYSGKNMETTKGGLTVYDSITSILFNTNNKKHYLFQRANLGSNLRNIQYCISDDLIKWSNWKMFKTNPELNYANTNIYYPNFFKIKDVNGYIGIIQFTTPNIVQYNTIGQIYLYYSDDCENWNYIGNMGEFKYYEHWLVSGEPLLKNNKYYFFYSDTTINIDDCGIEIYSLEKNRFSYAKSIKNEVAKLLLKPIFIKNNKIIINFKTYNGFIKMQLLDINKKIIDNYSFDDFDIIHDNCNKFDYIVSWNKNKNINIKEKIYIEIGGLNFELFSINY